MSDVTQETRTKIPLTRFLKDFRSSLTDHELREKYGLSARNFVSLIRALLARNIISPDDLAQRRELAVQRDLAKESQFLSGLFICPNCSHPHPEPFEKCPACGMEMEHTASGQRTRDPISTTGRHFYVDDDLDEEEEPETDNEKTPMKGGKQKATDKKPSSMGHIRSLLSKLKKK
jgi:hypothetical protein